jgi:HK97 family phage portal protein
LSLAGKLAQGLGVIEFKGGDMPRAIDNVLSDHAQRPQLTYDLIYAYYYNSWVYGSVKAIANSIADVPIIAVEFKGRTGRRPRSIRDFVRDGKTNRAQDWESTMVEYKRAEGAVEVQHDILGVLEDPYPEAGITEFELKQAIVTLLETDGNSYVECLWSGKDGAGLPKKLWPNIDPRKVAVVPGENRLVAGYIYFGDEGPVLYNWDQMLHFKYFAPLSPWYGMAPARVLRTQLIAETKAIDWNRLFFEHDATPGGLLTSRERLSPDDIRLMRNVWNDRYQGPGRSHQTAILGQGTSYQQISPSHKDMGFKELREFTKKEVQATYGVPAIVLGDYEDANRASAMTMARLYYLNTILPRLSKIEGVLNYRFMSGESNIRLMFNVATIEALQEDILVRARAGNYLAQNGFFTPNEIRAFHGKPKATGEAMDKVYLDPKMVPIGEVKQGGDQE